MKLEKIEHGFPKLKVKNTHKNSSPSLSWLDSVMHRVLTGMCEHWAAVGALPPSSLP